MAARIPVSKKAADVARLYQPLKVASASRKFAFGHREQQFGCEPSCNKVFGLGSEKVPKLAGIDCLNCQASPFEALRNCPYFGAVYTTEIMGNRITMRFQRVDPLLLIFPPFRVRSAILLLYNRHSHIQQHRVLIISWPRRIGNFWRCPHPGNDPAPMAFVTQLCAAAISTFVRRIPRRNIR